jgi:hypothetical protein
LLGFAGVAHQAAYLMASQEQLTGNRTANVSIGSSNKYIHAAIL